MVVVSLFLVLALVSSTVVAQPGIKGLTSLFSCSKPLETSEISTKIVYEWIPPRRWGPTPASNGDPVEIGLKYILQKLKLRSNEFMVMKNFTDHSESTHMYGVPLHEGLPIENLHAAAHIKKGRVFFYSATIGIKKKLTKRSPTTSKSRAVKSSKEAVNAAVKCLGVPFYRDVAPVMGSYWTRSGGMIPVWKFQLRDNPMTQWLQVKVNANTGGIVSMENFKMGFTYTALELPNKSPEDGFSTIIDPENIQSSPKGWTEGYKLAGNNAEIRFEGDTRFRTATKGVFGRGFDPTLSPETPKNMVAGAANAFYVTNTFHDTLYQYGFTESAGNFQQKNFGKGGKDGDSIFIDIQGSDKEDEAFFLTPPDGQYGVLYLHLYTATKPNRDPALDNTMLTHELTHGLSNRLTGGAHEGMCMEDVQSEGLNEGYSDMVSLIFTAKPEDARNTRRVIGGYVEGNLRGLREYPYTTNIKVNPLTYKDAVGEKDRYFLATIWTTMLFEVYWNFVDAHGFSTNLQDATQKRGNIMFLQILVETLMLQPCNPTFESARAAMLAADYAYYGGINKHLINKGFAKRGLGSIL